VGSRVLVFGMLPCVSFGAACEGPAVDVSTRAPDSGGPVDARSSARDAAEQPDGARSDSAHSDAGRGPCPAATCQGGPCKPNRVSSIPYSVLDAAYSRALDRIVIVSESGNALHLLDPHTGVDVAVALPATPTSVSVAPDGTHAAIGHDHLLSYVDLVTQSVVRTYAVSAPLGDVVLAGDMRAYGIPSNNQRVAVHTINLLTGQDDSSSGASVHVGTRGVVSRDSTALFLADNGVAPSSLYRYDITGAQPVGPTVAFGGTFEVCGNAWLGKDDSLLYTACGHIFRASDLSYGGSFSCAPQIVGVDESRDGRVTVLTGSSPSPLGGINQPVVGLQTYDSQDQTLQTSAPLPSLSAQGLPAATDGRYVFYDAAGTGTFVILHAADPVSQADLYGLASF
jgi:chitinase